MFINLQKPIKLFENIEFENEKIETRNSRRIDRIDRLNVFREDDDENKKTLHILDDENASSSRK